MFDLLYAIADSSFALASATADIVTEIAGRFGVQWKLLIAQIINFGIVTFILYRFAFKPILKTLADRENRIADGLQYSEVMEQNLKKSERELAATLRKAAVEAKGIIDAARDQAKQYLDDQTKSASSKAEDILKKAQVTIEHERSQMIKEARKDMANLVLATSVKVLKRDLSPEDRSAYSETAAKELALNNLTGNATPS